ncbi:MAG: HDOD domain-containing protein [Rubripirellula sp.]
MSKPNLSSARLGLRIDQAKWSLALPDGARRLIASGDFDGRDNETLVRWLSGEPELSKRLLRWCNTPMYNLSQPYQTLEQAAKVMDRCDLARLAVLAWVRGMFLPETQIDVYSREVLWAHSIAVGSVATLIARMCNVCDPGLVFIAGALHDVGLCASERLDPESFAEVVSQIDELSPTHEVEKDILGWDHCQLGEAILGQWGLPDAVTMSARHHHAPERVLDSEHADTIGCVAIANYLCSRSGWGATPAHSIVAPSDRVFKKLGIDAGLLTVLWTQLSTTLASVSGLR